MRADALRELRRALLPCAHCAGPAELEPMPKAAHWWRVRCVDYDCGATTWAKVGPEEAAAAWNRRADGPQ